MSNRIRHEQLNVRFSSAELMALRATAEQSGLPVSRLVRVLAAAEYDRQRLLYEARATR